MNREKPPSDLVAALSCALCFLVSVLLLSSCSTQKEKIYQKSKVLMDTLVTITVVSSSGSDAEKATAAAFAEIERLEGLLDFYSPESQISLINRNAGLSGARVSRDVVRLIDKAVFVSRKTDGAFDATVGPLSSLYNFHRHVRPDDSTIRARLALIDYRDLVPDHAGSAVRLKRRGMLVDTGGIAKGYAADRAAETLKKLGIRAGIVAVAGDIKTFGLKPDGRPWRIGIRDPNAKDGRDEVFATVELTDMAISTSGDYERFFFAGKRKIHHLLNPKTGYPSEACRSVSVIAEEGAFADAFATGAFVLGPGRGMRVLEEMGFGGIIVDNGGKSHLTPNMRGKVEFQGTSS
jgi:FAD:protein FMN transferase